MIRSAYYHPVSDREICLCWTQDSNRMREVHVYGARAADLLDRLAKCPRDGEHEHLILEQAIKEWIADND